MRRLEPIGIAKAKQSEARAKSEKDPRKFSQRKFGERREISRGGKEMKQCRRFRLLP
jgi:hypothetical protein